MFFIKKSPSSFPKTAIQQSSDEALGDFINNKSDFQDVPSVNPPEDLQALLIAIKQADHSALNDVLLKTLSPQLAANEVQKREFKLGIVKYIKKILAFQIFVVLVIVVFFFLNICFDIPCMQNITLEQMNLVINFLKYYITAIIAEFIAMLFFIVKYVFDKSIVDLTNELLKKE